MGRCRGIWSGAVYGYLEWGGVWVFLILVIGVDLI